MGSVGPNFGMVTFGKQQSQNLSVQYNEQPPSEESMRHAVMIALYQAALERGNERGNVSAAPNEK